ncbi:GNAT family N-acetyltransferase [Methanosphaera sp. ISO3-F5]|uniref:GNAT family N-acetyltransferase n=1 Tax=Methanosphaera sp. ISO3-F5 TaxID=1452353 RepID=UPI002B25BEB6|nr:GNAT family N-acetyltransferase [Methanosphaera sp. ISO3-F5]WQH63721.1 GNAT family N-acetyltransferase [Methanosphaera sp. ISO3-F5]
MIMIDYIIRDNQESEVFESNDDTLNAKNILKENYPYIYECMKKEGFILENTECNIFKELLYDNKVVGFIAYNIDEDFDSISLVNVYIMPEYRGNSILYNELSKILKSDIVFSVLEPNNLIIDLFIKYGFAEKLNEYLVASSISLDVKSENYISNTNDFILDDDSFYGSNLYDTAISATLLLIDISSPGSNIICYSKTLESDKVNYNAEKHRNNIQSHLKNVKEDMLENCDLFADILVDLKENLPKPEYDINELVGKPPELSEILKIALEEIGKERVKEIQEQLIEEYDEGIVRNEALFKRLKFLLVEDEIIDEILLENDITEVSCPYCYSPINLSDISCKICGYNLQYSNEEEMQIFSEFFDELIKKITNKNNGRESLRGLFSKSDYSLNSETDSDEITSLSVATVKIISILHDLTPLDNACEYISLSTGFEPKILKEHMIKEGYVGKEISKDNWNIIANKMKVPQLKDILRTDGQKVSGKKQELIERIEKNVDLSAYNPLDLIGQEYIITKNAINYLNENNFLLLAGNMLEDYDLMEYKNFLNENNYEDSYQTELSFLELHEQKALQEDDHEYIKTVLESKRAIYKALKKCDGEEFVNELKIFSLNLNRDYPIFMAFVDFSKEELEIGNVKQLRKLSKNTRYPYESMMLEIYDNTPYDKKFTVDNMVLILDDIFKGINLSTIRSNLFKYREEYQKHFKNLDDYI